MAANGPAVGGVVTSAALCDAVVASETATFSTPFAALGLVPEGCSSVHFERVMGGRERAERMLGPERADGPGGQGGRPRHGGGAA